MKKRVLKSVLCLAMAGMMVITTLPSPVQAGLLDNISDLIPDDVDISLPGSGDINLPGSGDINLPSGDNLPSKDDIQAVIGDLNDYTNEQLDKYKNAKEPTGVVTATLTSQTSASLNFDISYTGEDTIDGYSVYYKTATTDDYPESPNKTYTPSTEGDTTSISLYPLDSNTTYDVKIVAFNYKYDPDSEDKSQRLTRLDGNPWIQRFTTDEALAPSGKVSLIAKDSTATSFILEITYTGTDTVLAYDVSYKKTGETEYSTPVPVMAAAGSVTEAPLTGLAPNTSYDVKVVPYNVKYSSTSNTKSEKLPGNETTHGYGTFLTKDLTAPAGTIAIAKQTEALFNSVVVEYTSDIDANLTDGVLSYKAQFSEDVAGWNETTATWQDGIVFLAPTQKKATIKGTNKNPIQSGKAYYVRLIPYTSVATAPGYQKEGKPSNAIQVVTTPFEATKSIKNVSASTTTMNISWEAADSANIYKVEYKAKNATTYLSTEVSGTSTTLTGLVANTLYTIRVTAGMKNKAGDFTTWSVATKEVSDLALTPGKLNAPECTFYYQNKANRSAVFETDATDCVTDFEYQVYYYTGGKYKQLKKSTIVRNTNGISAATIKNTEFTKHKMFRVKVRGISYTSDGIAQTGQWSDWTYFCPQPDIIKNKITCSKKGINLTWDKITGAKRYAVYVSTQYKSGYKLYKTTGKTNITVSKFGKKALKKNKTYYFYIVPQIKVSGKWQNIEAGNSSIRWQKKYKY